MKYTIVHKNVPWYFSNVTWYTLNVLWYIKIYHMVHRNVPWYISNVIWYISNVPWYICMVLWCTSLYVKIYSMNNLVEPISLINRQFGTLLGAIGREEDVSQLRGFNCHSRWLIQCIPRSCCPSRSRYMHYASRQLLLYVFTQVSSDI